MSNARSEAAAPSPSAFAPFSALLGAMPQGQAMALVVPHCQASLLRAFAEHQREWHAFVSRRWGEQMDLADEIRDARQPSDLASAVQGFVQRAAEQYSEEAYRMASIGSEGALAAARVMGDEIQLVTDRKGRPTVNLVVTGEAA